MNEEVNTFLLAGDKFMPEMHLKQPGFTYSACGPFTMNKERIQKFEETGDTSYIYKNELDKASFQHDKAYEDFKYLARKTASDKVLRDKAFNIAKNSRYEGYQRGFASMVYKFFDKKLASLPDKSVSGRGVNINVKPSKQLSVELNKLIIRNLKKRTVYSKFKGNIWGANLADTQLISKFNKRFRFLVCVIYIFSKYAGVVPLKDKKGASIVDVFERS